MFLRDKFAVRLTPYGVKIMSQYYPYVPSKDDLSVVPFLLDEFAKDQTKEEGEEEEPHPPEFCFSTTFAPAFIDECIWLGY